MTFRQLEYFVQIAEKGSFTSAAKSLHVSQPSLSQHMALLGEELGIALFERDLSPLVLTAEGEVLLEKVKEILEIKENIYSSFCKTEQRKTLKIGISDVGTLINTEIFPLFKQKCPDTDIVLKEADFLTLNSMLKKGELDIMLSSRPEESEKIFVCKTLLDRMILALPPQNPLAEKYIAGEKTWQIKQKNGEYPTIDMSECGVFPYILAGRVAYKDFQLAFLKNHFKPAISLEVEKISTGLSMLESTGSALLIPGFYAKLSGKDDRAVYFSIDGGTPEWELCISMRASGKNKKQVAEYIALASELAETLQIFDPK